MPARLPDVSFPKTPVRYPSITIDSYWGTTQSIQLKRTQGVVEYDLIVTEGTLSGGTTPAWAPSKSAPTISHMNIQADNTTLHDYDGQMLVEYEWLTRNAPTDGLNFVVTMCDIDYHSNGRLLEHSVFPSYSFSQNVMNITFATLAQVTTGTPTSSSGTTLTITEQAVPRSLITFKPLLVKRLQAGSVLSNTGDNVFPTLLPQTGAYKAIMSFVTNQSTSSYANYANGSDTIPSFINLKLNDVVTDTDIWWLALKRQDQALFGRTPDTGYTIRAWMPDNDTSKLLALADTTTITGIALNYNTTGSGYVTVLKVQYA